MNTREIKFRVWDKQHNKMLAHVYKMGSGFPSPIYCYDLMQYTGLKDKNNKEIFDYHSVLLCKQIIGNQNNTKKKYNHYDRQI